jgi:outer membrane cobalamin receptor
MFLKNFAMLFKNSRSVRPGFFICAFIFLFKITLTAQVKDSVFQTKGVEVTADKASETNVSALAPITVISKEELEKSGAWQISDALSYVPGLFVKNYGGLGGLKTISLRGTSASQAAILINGVRLNSAQNGQFDFSALPATLAEEINVIRGGASTLYGANAIGGAVNILTASRKENIFKTDVHLGSFKSELYSAYGSWAISDSTQVSALGEFTSSRGDYPFKTEQFGETVEMRRANGDFKNISGMLTATFPLKTWKFTTQAIARNTERGTPGAVLQGRVESSNARLTENDLLVSLGALKNITEDSGLEIILATKFNTQKFNDPEFVFGGNSGESNFKNRDISARITSQNFFKNWIIRFTGEGSYADLKGDNLQKEAGDFVRRQNVAFAAHFEREFAFDTVQAITLQSGLRFDWFSDAGQSFSPLVGGAFTFLKELRFRGQWSYNFRPPSFNELYYLNYGNTNVKPERSHSFNIGAIWLPFKNIFFETEIFFIRTNDQIVSVPKNPVQWSAQNIGLVATRGIELTTQLLYNEDFTFRTSYTFQTATDETPQSYSKGKQVVYVPNHIANAVMSGVFFKTDVFKSTLGIQGQLSGDRFSLPDNSHDSRLSEFITLDVYVIQEITYENNMFKIRADVINLFNEQFSIVRNYPMPGRNFRFGLAYQL